MAGNNKQNNRKNQNGRNRRSNKDKFEWKKASKTLSFWILIILGSIVISQLYSNRYQREAEVPYTEYISLLESGQIQSATIIDNEFHGVLRPESAVTLPGGGDKFKTVLPYIDHDALEQWDKNNISYKFENKTTNWLGYILSSILPWIILIGIWILLMRRMQGGGTRGIFSFGKSKAKLLTENRPKLTFADVAGADEAKAELEEIIEFLREPKKFQKLGGRLPRGALLLGPPGTGKTLLAKAVAGEAEVPFFSMSGADFVEMFVGVGASRVRDLFEQGKKNAPCIIFIDEIDAVGRHRGAGLGGGHDEREQTLNQLLVEMDGFDSNEGVILIAATNRPDVLDPALLRPGRFDRQIVVDRPDVRGRLGIFKVHTKKIPLNEDVDLQVLAKGTPGLSGADIANLVNEAALLASRRDAASVFMRDFEDAKDKVMMGVERKSMLISDAEKRNTAYHEAGHVLVSKLVPGSDPVHKVTIIPRGRALGLTHFLPIDEKHNYSKSFLETTLVNLLGGRVAELIVMNELTTGAGNDIERATELARKMVCEWGMSEKLGPLTYGAKEEEIFLGREITRRRNYSESTAIQIDSEIKYIVSRAEKRADKFVRDNIVKLHALAEALLERELLDGHEIDLIMKGKILPPLKKQASVKSPPKMKRPASKTKRRPTESASGTSIPKPIVIESKPTVPEPKTEVSEPKSEEKKSTQKRHSTSRSRKRKRPGAGGGTQPVKPAAVQPVKSVEDSKKPVDKLKSESPEKPAAEVRTEISGAPKSGKTEHPGISKTYKINKTQYDKIKDKISGGQRKSDDTSGRTDNLIKAEDKSNQAVKANDTAKKTKTEDPKLFSDEIEKKPRRVFSEPAYKKETEISAEQKKDVKLDSSGPPPSSTLRRQTSVPTKSRPVIDKKTPVKPAVFETPEWLKNINHRKDGKKQEKFSLESAKIQSASSDKPPSESPGILNDRGDNQQDNKDAV